MIDDKVIQTLSNAGLTTNEADALISEMNRLGNVFPVAPEEAGLAVTRVLNNLRTEETI